MKNQSLKKLNKGHLYGLLGVAAAMVSQEAFAAGEVVDSAAALSPLLDKILGSLRGTLGKVILGIGLVLSATAGLAGMNKVVVFTPIGVGLMLGSAGSIINWMFAG